MIYRFALAQGATHKKCKHPAEDIGIEDMDQAKYKLYRVSRRAGFRTTYEPAINGDTGCCCPFHHHLHYASTTYTLATSRKISGMGLLRADKQTRAEAIPIFYGENIFTFRDMTAVRPFLRDRPQSTRRMIRHMRLVLPLEHEDGFHHVRQAEWLKVFRYLALYLNLKRLDVCVLDWAFPSLDPPELTGPKQEWVGALAQIKDLERFTFSLDVVGRDAYFDILFQDGLDEEEIDYEIDDFDRWVFDSEFEYSYYISSKMSEKRQITLERWLKHHKCSTECKEVGKGRAAARPGLPRSTTRGKWTLPEVDVDALYDSADPEDLSDEEYSDTEDTDGDGYDTKQHPDTDAGTNDEFHDCREDFERESSIEL